MHQYDDVIFPKQTEGEGASDTEEIEIQYGTGVKKVQVSKTAGGLIPTKPVVTHEIGQYEVYPDFREIDKYTAESPELRDFPVPARCKGNAAPGGQVLPVQRRTGGCLL